MIGQIPPEIGVLVYMTSYISFFNAQSGPIPTSLGLIAPLQTFDVESNNMDGDLFQPEYSGSNGLTEVINFRASLNNFRGNIPTEIGRWTKLQNLWFADNEIEGTIPAEIGQLVDMSKFFDDIDTFLVEFSLLYIMHSPYCIQSLLQTNVPHRCIPILQE